MATATASAPLDAPPIAEPTPVAAVVFSQSRLVRAGITKTLDRAGFRVAAEATTPAMALSSARRASATIAVIDMEGEFGPSFGIEAFRELAKAAQVIVLCDSPTTSGLALMAGATACLPRSATAQELALAADWAGRGRPLIGGSAVLELVKLAAAGRVNRHATEVMRKRLSPREMDVVRGLAHGWGNGVIAASLHISPKTVKNHVGNILHKLGLENRIQAAVIAVQAGIATGDIVSNVDAVRAALDAGPDEIPRR